MLSNNKEEIIKLNNITKKYGHRTILDNINLSINAGDFISILGLSGSGKSTLLNILGMLDVDYTGTYFFDGSIVNKNNIEDLRKKNIGYVFQLYYLISSLSIKENILLPYLYIDEYNVKELNEKLSTLLERLNLNHLLEQDCSSLSGGEKQRVALARALIHDPKLIICDEPTGNLDKYNTEIVMDILREEHNKGKTIIVVTHSHEVACKTDIVFCIESGGIRVEKNFKTD